MNSRERILAMLLIGIMCAAAGGFFGYQFVFSPWKKANEDSAKLESEIAKLTDDKREIERQQFVYENKTKKKSLPLDATLAQGEYERLLAGLLRNAKFQAPSISPRTANTSNVPTVGNKKPIYTKLDFEVHVKGDEESLVEFLHSFYRQPLLHQIQRINITKPTSQRNQSGTSELEIVLTIEALVLDRAENRPTLLPALPPVVLASGGGAAAGISIRSTENGRGSVVFSSGVLARDEHRTMASADKEYRQIAQKDIFFGTPPLVRGTDEERVVEADLAPYVILTTISHNGRGFAEVHDWYHKYDYEIEEDAKGSITVKKWWYLFPKNERMLCHNDFTVKEGYYHPRYLTFGSQETGNERSYIVRRIVEDGILVQEYDEKRIRVMKYGAPAVFGGSANLALPGNMYYWHIGQYIKKKEVPGGSMEPIVLKDEDKKLRGWRSDADATRYQLLRPLQLLEQPANTDEPAASGQTAPAAPMPKKGMKKKKGNG